MTGKADLRSWGLAPWEDERTTCGRVQEWLSAHDYAPDAQPTAEELPGDCDLCIAGRCDINGREFGGPCLGQVALSDPQWRRAYLWRLRDGVLCFTADGVRAWPGGAR